jgi:hypothetical protein
MTGGDRKRMTGGNAKMMTGGGRRMKTGGDERTMHDDAIAKLLPLPRSVIHPLVFIIVITCVLVNGFHYKNC